MTETPTERRLRSIALHTRMNDDDSAAIDKGRQAIALLRTLSPRHGRGCIWCGVVWSSGPGPCCARRAKFYALLTACQED